MARLLFLMQIPRYWLNRRMDSTCGQSESVCVHTITLRPADDNERRVILSEARPQLGALGCLVIVMGAGTVGFWLIGGWIGSFLSPQAKSVGQWAGVLIGIALLLFVASSFWRFSRRHRRRAAGDVRDATVEHIIVSEARVVALVPLGDHDDPALAFDIGDGKILLLQGQWLRDENVYNAPRPLPDDRLEDFVNGLPSPHSFPSDAFEIIRLPHSGRVLGIRVRGSYLTPLPAVDALRRGYEFGDSLVCEGELDHVAAALQNAAGQVAV